jgi:hypothetical protein
MRTGSRRCSTRHPIFLVALTACLACDATRPSRNLEGRWEGQFAGNTPTDSISISFTQSDSILYGNGFLRFGSRNANTGPVYFPLQVVGTVSGRTVDLVISEGPVQSRLHGYLMGGRMPAVFEYTTVGTYPIVLHRSSIVFGQ